MLTKSEECVFQLLNQKQSVCRICFHQLEEATNKDQEFFKMLQFSCPDLLLCEDPRLPHHLCQSCFVLLQKCYKFLINVHSSHTLLNKYLETLGPQRDQLSVEKLHLFYEVKPETLKQASSASDNAHFKRGATNFHACQSCMKKYRSKYELEVHQRVHSGEKPFACSVCQKSFTDNRNLKRHLKIHSEDKKHECPTCQKKFLHLFSLKTHQRIHTGEKHYVCEMCGKPFNTSGELTIHSRIHTRLKPYACTICSKAFSSKSTLNTHMSVHTGDRKHSCVICSRKFRTSYDLKVHMRCHDNEKPYFCKYANCDKTYRSNSQLNVHLRTHTGEKRHQCGVCLKKFGESSTLKRHFLTHGGTS
ncbi:zinc finger protein 239 [Dendroctonus ponderosae]|uniref:Protein krueppel n=1 Tax=Dendroctonus ponderosae TaxID=77166 RepID=A0AAR5PN79_DENPD|nr:zinc finger protein 239 [Dendroctonus ponderosae]